MHLPFGITGRIKKNKDNIDANDSDISGLDSRLSAVEGDVGTLAGGVSAFATDSVPTGWMECNGSPLSSGDFPELFAVIGTNYGHGNDGAPTDDFNLPDLRGRFPRGWVSNYAPATDVDPDSAVLGPFSWTRLDTEFGIVTVGDDVSDYYYYRWKNAIIEGDGIPAGTRIVDWVGTILTMSHAATANTSTGTIFINCDTIGTYQEDYFESHTHSELKAAYRAAPIAFGNNATYTDNNTGSTTGATGGNETRPININFMYCIKYA